MDNNKSIEFECETCGVMFRDRLFDIARAYELVIFDGPTGYPEVESSNAEGVANFCSSSCRDSGRESVMRGEGYPLPGTSPGIGPVEECAQCSGVVDTTHWHLTYTESDMITSHASFQPVKLNYLAVVCKSCAPKDAAGATQPFTANLGGFTS
jgi:hypothetical protein